MRGGTQNRRGEPPGEFVQALGSPGRGAGPAIAGSEGSGFSLEKPRRRRNAGLDIWGARYLRLRRKAWPLAKPDPSVSCADSSALH